MSRQYYEPNPNYWVSKEVHDELKKEVELWKLRSDNWQKFCQLTRPDLTDEVTRLKAEVENSNRINTELLLLSNQQASEVRRLKAEVERLNTGIQPEGSNDAVGRAVNVLLEKEKENARLKAEVERLTKAGDAYEDELNHLTDCPRMLESEKRVLKELFADWNAAKQGGQP